MEGYHKSVLLREVVNALDIRDAWYLDCTLGDGGHSIEVIKRGGKVVGIDVDPQALERVRNRFRDEGVDEDKFRLVQGNFRDIKNIVEKQTELKDQQFAGAVFDLGVSSLQLESPERGFSFGKQGPLDMRMDPNLAVQALDLVNNLSRKELYGLFYRLGEEKYSWRLANALVSARQVRPFQTTIELSEFVERIVGGGRRKIPDYAKASVGKHPATRVFQALRMAVNDELGALEEGLEQVKDLIEQDGRIAVISFHSLEDRIVKNKFKDWQVTGVGVALTKKPVIPSEEEIRENPRSRSAKMRVFKKYKLL